MLPRFIDAKVTGTDSIVSASASGQGRKTRPRFEIVEFLVIANVKATRVP
jgi:hypothetical protein